MSEVLSATDADAIFATILGKMLLSSRFPLSSEKATQAYISRALSALNIDHIREQRLAPGDIVDFWLPSKSELGAVIEVKMNSARPPDVLKQLERYAGHRQVRAVFLVSNRAMGLPKEIAGKPAYYFSLGRAWL
jgi:hypothetical protein